MFFFHATYLQLFNFYFLFFRSWCVTIRKSAEHDQRVSGVLPSDAFSLFLSTIKFALSQWISEFAEPEKYDAGEKAGHIFPRSTLQRPRWKCMQRLVR